MLTLDQEPQLVLDARCDIGENPLWDEQASCLVFLDITAGVVHRFHPSDLASARVAVGDMIGGMTLQADGALALFGVGTVTMLHRNGRIERVRDGLLKQGERFNDVIADPAGRVFAGTVVDHGRGRGGGRLLRLDPDGAVHEIFSGLDIPNGLGFSPDHSNLYFTDSRRRTISAHRYDPATGTLSPGRPLITIDDLHGCPDGMAVDAAGYIWTAVWHGACLQRFAPDGALERLIPLPIRQPAALAFGGDGLHEIYLTSASSSVGDALAPPALDRSLPRGGGVYALRLPGITGMPPSRSRLPCSTCRPA